MIAIIDYGVGNLRSVEKAFQFLGYKACVTNDKSMIKASDGVVLPGVGAFAEAMERLKAEKMDKVVYKLVEEGTPLIGICVGMQMLFDYSEEGGNVRGLGILPGTVKRIPDNLHLKVPHMGWNRLDIARENNLWTNLPEKPYAYFVHSYYINADNKDDVIATTDYGIKLDVAVNRGNLFATQFHPEKSGEVGLKILKNFVEKVVKQVYAYRES